MSDGTGGHVGNYVWQYLIKHWSLGSLGASVLRCRSYTEKGRTSQIGTSYVWILMFLQVLRRRFGIVWRVMYMPQSPYCHKKGTSNANWADGSGAYTTIFARWYRFMNRHMTTPGGLAKAGYVQQWLSKIGKAEGMSWSPCYTILISDPVADCAW